MKKIISACLPLFLLVCAFYLGTLAGELKNTLNSNYANYYEKTEILLDSIAEETQDTFYDVIVETDYYDEYLNARDQVNVY